MNRSFWLLSLVFSLGNCLPSEMKISDYINNPDNGIIQEKEVGAFKFQVQYLPLAYQAKYADNPKELLGHQYFKMVIQATGEDQKFKEVVAETLTGDVEKIINQLRFHLQNNLRVYSDKGLMPCVLYHALPMNFQERGLELLLVFKDKKVTQTEEFTSDLIFEFEDQYLTNKTIKLTFSKEHLNRILDYCKKHIS